MNYYPPEAETMEGWGKFRKEFKENAPIRYFLVENGPHIAAINRIKWFKNDVLNSIKYFFSAPNIIKTGLPRRYHDAPELMFHGCFSLLVDYVEKECAHMNCVFDTKEKKKEFLKWKRFLPRFLRFNKNRHKEFGLEHLRWEISLGDESPVQSKDAEEILKLYLWYTKIRPNRIEPECPEMPERESFFSMFSEEWKNTQEYVEFEKYCDEMTRLETQWEEEDDRMLVRLVKVRHALWT